MRTAMPSGVGIGHQIRNRDDKSRAHTDCMLAKSVGIFSSGCFELKDTPDPAKRHRIVEKLISRNSSCAGFSSRIHSC